jgi:hypothetical protein
MINKTLIAAFAITRLGLGEAAMAASEISQQEKDDHGNLIALVEAIGIPVSFNGVPCDKGWHGGYAYNGSAFVVCANKQVSLQEKLDTVRHEAWHVYQDIRDCNIKDDVAVLPVFSVGVVEPSFIAMASKGYHPSQVASEAEAAWAARTFDAEQINILLFTKAKSCGYKL